MNSAEARGDAASGARTTPRADMKLEVAVIPVSDVDRAKQFYGDLGWRLDADIKGDGFRVIQFTPPGSPCSIIFGAGVKPGFYLVVSDIMAAQAELVERGVRASEVYHYDDRRVRVSGPEPSRRSYASWASFSDPAGNSFLLQEVTRRLPGRVEEGATTFASSTELASALRRAAAAHGEHEKRAGGARDANWPDWYADYIVREQAGKDLPS
ncbi:MAG TPA: VOC family protein [Acetobacteraceae bacterium]|nr:VOC family protein [Acetobacteraceae bacterium]